MKRNAFSSTARLLPWLSSCSGLWLATVFVLLTVVTPGMAGGLQKVHYRLSETMTNASLVAPSLGWKKLNLAIGLPLRNPATLDQLIAEINDPASPRYHQYLTPAQFTEQFGPTEQDYAAVARFAQAHGLTVTGRHANRMVLDVSGLAVNIERTFHVKLGVYQHPTEDRTFFAPDTEPSIDLAVPVLSISGLDNYQLPHPMNLKKMSATGASSVAPQTGSGPSGTYLGQDFRAAYVPGVTLTGTGQTVGLLEFDSGFYPNDISTYESTAGLPNVPVQAVLLDGYNGAAGGGNVEVSLDIEMAISIAPGLSNVLVYEGSATDDILNRMATDNLAKQIGASWTYSIDAVSEQIFKEYAVQGQSFFNASGDSDAYPGTVSTPCDDTNIICVGGTTLTTTGPGGAWVSEKVWNWGGGTGSSGGISTVNAIPSWQQGLSMAANQGSTSLRNLPDVAMVADNIWVIYGNGKSGSFGGTSCATPLWAGFIALANQLALANREPAVGFINPAVYAMGKGSNSLSYTALFHDITTGNNESSRSPSKFSAVTGYDLCTGWGTPTGGNLLSALALPEPLRITPAGGAIISGPVGGPFNPVTVVYNLTNNGVNSFNWSLVNTSSWLTVFPANGTLISGQPAAQVTASISTVASNLVAGSYGATLQFSNRTDHFGQTRQITLAIVTPPVLTTQPTNQAVLEGATASFNIATGTNALLYYQWQINGANLTDAGNISGSATDTLTITNVTAINAGSYSVIVSNAAGMIVSSNALLAITPSAPVIVQQPTNQTVLPGAPAAFSVGVVGNTPYTFQWQFNGLKLLNGVNVSGAATSTLVINNATAARAGVYSVVVNNSLGSITSTGAVLSLIPVTAPGVAMSPTASFDGTTGEFLYSPVTQGRDGYLYGTTFEGGKYGDGVVFRALTNGTLVSMHSFNYTDGAIAYAGLVLAKDGYFYGTTYLGGTYGDGTVFRISAIGTLQTLASFTGENGMTPVAGLIQGTDGNLYGTTLQGGAYGYGTIFKMTTGGVLTTLVSFDYANGADPSSVLVQGADGYLYGTTEIGGTNGLGTIFKVSTSGAFTSLYSFTGTTDGAEPVPGLIQATDGNFYGVTIVGGGGYGTLFQVTPSGALNIYYTFTNGLDGGNPWGGLMQASDGNIYGTTQGGGTYGNGTVFRIAPNGPFTPLVQFDGYAGANPSAALIQATNGDLYGTTYQGGSAGDGVIYSLSFSGALQISSQPEDQLVYVGGTAQFTVGTFGSAPVFYQWRQDGVNLTNGGNISGATSATLTIAGVASDDAAVYSVVVSNAVNTVTSDDAVLAVGYSPPSITSQPASLARVAGMNASFAVSATGDAPLSYQWQENGTNLTDGGNISGSATSTLNLTSVTLANAGTYSVMVSNALFAVSSFPATLTVVPAVAPGAELTVLHPFSGGIEGAFPYAGLVQGRDGNLYGTAVQGGYKYGGTVFRETLAGGIFTLHGFAAGSDGANPYGPLVQGTNGNFYGTTLQAGNNGYGTIYRLSPGVLLPAPYSVLYSYVGGTDGGNPYAGLIQAADGNLYGTTYGGGANSLGAVFKMTANSVVTGFYQFTGGDDGAYPYGTLIQGTDGNFYGTALEGGAGFDGTVFRLNTNGTLTTLVAFDFANGGFPQAGVIQGTDGNFYGTTVEGGIYGYGTVFSVTTNGTLTTLHSFDSTDGANPTGPLMQGNDGNFYGTTSTGGTGGQGTVFKLTTNGVLTTLVWFNGFNGASPQGALLQANNGSFYGTTAFGGPAFNPTAGGGFGTLFRLTVPVFVTNSLTAPAAIGNLPYSVALIGAAIAPLGDPLTFAKVSGPAWLTVATNDVLSGTPANSDIGTNTFVISLTDSNGISAWATLKIVVGQDPPPSFIANPFTEPFADADVAYSATIATNASDLELAYGDVMTFAKASGPAWLGVAADGTLSGTPQGADGGTNTFVVSVTNLGGLTNTATLTIYVYRPPYFAPQSFTKPAATVGLPYSGTIATNAVDLDASAGDMLTFYKVSGPLWLYVAPNGDLSGTPSSTDAGISYSLMLVVNSGGLAGVGTLNLAVNADHAPVFVSNPFTAPHANIGQAYVATISTSASDPDFGDAMTFAKVNGPAWLTVSPFGLLSGTPANTDVGTNIFAVSVTDLSGLSNRANLYIDVAAPIYLGIAQSNGQVLLDWTGGYPPYQVLSGTGSTNMIWSNLGGPLNTNALLLTPTNPANWYRVQGQ